MQQNSNDALWNPRPRIVRQGDRLHTGESPPDEGSVLVELVAADGMTPVAALEQARRLSVPGFTLDEEFGAVAMGDDPSRPTFIVRGHVSDDGVVPELERDAGVAKVWRDSPTAPF
jgi:hypothetical protein